MGSSYLTSVFSVLKAVKDNKTANNVANGTVMSNYLKKKTLSNTLFALKVNNQAIYWSYVFWQVNNFKKETEKTYIWSCIKLLSYIILFYPVYKFSIAF